MTVRFGLLGTGYWATTVHGTGIAAHPAAELAGVWGRDPVKATDAARTLGCLPYLDLDELLADVDAVSIAVPPTVQPELAIRAARAGRHLMLEKPVAVTTADAAALAAESAGVASVVFFTLQFAEPTASWLREAVRAGGWHTAQAHWFSAFDAPGSPYATSPWRGEYGGLWDLGPHVLSLLVPLLGDVAEVSAIGGADGLAHLLLRHDGGATSAASLSVTMPEPATGTGAVLYGEAGVNAMPEYRGDVPPAFAAALDELLAAVDARATGEPAAGHGHDIAFGARVVEILAAAQRSIDAGRPLTIGD